MSTISRGRRSPQSHRSVVSTQPHTTRRPPITTDSRTIANKVREKVSQPPSSPSLSDARKKRQYERRADPKPSPIHSYSAPHYNYSSSSSFKTPLTGTSTHNILHDKRSSQSFNTQRSSSDDRYHHQHHGALANSVLHKKPPLWKAEKATMVDTSYLYGSRPAQPHHTSYTSSYSSSYTAGISSPSLKPRTSSISQTQSQTSYSPSFNTTTSTAPAVGDTTGARHFSHHRGSHSVDSIPVAGLRTSPESSVSPLPQISKRTSIDLVAAQLDSKVSSRKIVTVPSLLTSHSGLLGLYNSGNTVSKGVYFGFYFNFIHNECDYYYSYAFP